MLWVNDQLFLIRNHIAQTIKYPRLQGRLLPEKDAGSALLALLILLFAFLVATFFGWSIALIAFALVLVIPVPFVLRRALHCNAYNRRLRDYLAMKLRQAEHRLIWQYVSPIVV